MHRVDLGTATDVGLIRSSNEDALLVLGPADGLDGVLLAVADGMGGHRAGEVASALAIGAVSKAMQVRRGHSPAERLRHAVEVANRAIWEAARADPEQDGMGTTLVCALLAESGELAVANVGDSRAYLVGADAARLVTEDHSWVAEEVRAGRMSDRDAEVSPYRHVLSRSLGVRPVVEVDVFQNVTLRAEDALVLCSDGVSGYVEPDDLLRVLAEAGTAQEAADALVRLALRRGGADNATVVLARLLS